MRFILRVLGTWLLGIALVLLIIDGTRSLGASAFVMTSLGESWALIHADSLVTVRQWSTEFLPEFLATQIFERLLGWPGWAVLAVPGVILALAGRTRRTRIDRFNQV